MLFEAYGLRVTPFPRALPRRRGGYAFSSRKEGGMGKLRPSKGKGHWSIKTFFS